MPPKRYMMVVNKAAAVALFTFSKFNFTRINAITVVANTSKKPSTHK